MEREYGVQQDHREGFTDNWAAVRAGIERQTPNNLHLGALPETQNSSRTAEASFGFGAMPAAGLLSYLDSDPLSPDSSSEETLRRRLDGVVSPTPSSLLSLSLEILEPELEETVGSDPAAEA